jgi:hypothetical protein
MTQAALIAAENVGAAVAAATTGGNRVVDKVVYQPSNNSLLITCGPLTLAVDVKSIPGLTVLSREALEQVELSASGATIMIESSNIYIEAATLVLSQLDRIIKSKKTGNLIMDFLQKPPRST